MEKKCINKECAAPINCHEGESDYKICKNWLDGIAKKEGAKQTSNKNFPKTNLKWTGNPFKKEDIAQISRRSFPIMIGIIGKAGAGKTTFLAMVYTLLIKGRKIGNYNFVGSKTLLGWDELHHKLKILNQNVAFPDATPSEYYRLLHLALRGNDKVLRDIFFSDASGEVFSTWSQSREDDNAENARWIYSTSDAFILFIDCEDLVIRKNLAKTEIIDIAQMLLHNLRNRPVIAVWSKADKKNEINDYLRESLSEELQRIFTNYEEIEVSNFSVEDPDVKVHVNNLKVIDWLLNKMLYVSGQNLIIDHKTCNDLFLDYRGT